MIRWKLCFKAVILSMTCCSVICLVACSKQNKEQFVRDAAKEQLYAVTTNNQSVSTSQSPEDMSLSDYLTELRNERYNAADNAAVSVIANIGDEIDIDGLLVKVTYVKFYDNVYEIQADGIPYVDDYIQSAIKWRRTQIEKGLDSAKYYDEETGRYIHSVDGSSPKIFVIQYEYHDTKKNPGIYEIYPTVAIVRDSLDFTPVSSFSSMRIYADEFEFDRNDQDCYNDVSIAKKGIDNCVHLTVFALMGFHNGPEYPDVAKLYLDFSRNQDHYSTKKANERATYRFKIYERE